MNRDQKAAVIDEIATNIQDSQAIFAVDFRGMTVSQAAELRDKLRLVDATFRVVKNSLADRAADAAGVAQLKGLLAGPTALTFVGGDAATAAKAIADYARITQKLAFKGGVMDGLELTPEQVTAISRLPSRDVLYGQLVGLVASPLTGLVRTLSALVGGLAIQLGAILEKKESGEIPAGDPPAALVAPPAPAAAATQEPEASVEPAGASEPHAAPAPEVEAPVAAETAPPAVAPVEVKPGDAKAQDTTSATEPAAEAEAAPAAGPTEPDDAATASSAAQVPSANPTQDSGDEVAGAKDAQAGEAQAEPAPAAAAPVTEEPSSDKENH